MNEDSLYNRLAKGILTDEEIDNLVDEIMNIPSEKNNNCVSTYGSINVDDLISNVKEFKKIPTFDNLLKENKTLKQQLDYLRSGEYYNQLRFENEMLQNIVDTNGVPSEVYDYIECTHRNTELLEENEQLKKELEQSNAVADTNKELAESFHKENERLKSLLKCDYEDNQEIMADIIKEKQELIDYLKLSIEFEKSNSLWTSKKRLKVYEEILSKIEKR